MTALTACTTLDGSTAFLTPSEALQRAAELDGKRISIGGVVDLGTNSRCLYDSTAAIAERKGDGARVVTLSGGDHLLQRRGELNHRFVIVTGTFKRVFNAPDVVDLYQCNDAGIEQDTIRLARRVPNIR
ncbi:hypothetical protein ACFSCW_02735 [Sphingomonas tabacisoli]|uniref:Uncharacterized protein n=1 Tax=Sphingomonas tabacisoli TaxID=2249466 RepID=A0ABW4HZY7_9SPHN